LTTLTNLFNLNLYANSITTIEGLECLKNLKNLRIGNNPIPNEIIGRSGGIDKNGYALNPQKFVVFCKIQSSGGLGGTEGNGELNS